MGKTNKEKLLDYLWSIAPNGASNSQIRTAIGSNSHQSIYMLTQELMGQGVIEAKRPGREWIFYANESAEVQLASPGRIYPTSKTENNLTPQKFENLARYIMGKYFGTPLHEREIPGVPKRFDMVSKDGRIVGDAKYYTLVQGHRLPPAKFSVIAEHVWLLEKTNAKKKFLVFGNDIEVPRLWLARYGKLVKAIAFYFLSDSGDLTDLLKS